MEDNPVVDGNIKIIVQKVLVEGCGAIILTGPSSCGKGEIAKDLRKFLSIPQERHLSMGNILRMTIKKARMDEDFRNRLSAEYEISDKISIFKEKSNSAIYAKARKHENELKSFYGDKPTISQLDWLEFCVKNGLLVPDKWTVNIINATFQSSEEFKNQIFILDGYPRTIKAAEELMSTFTAFNIPIIKVIHLSITKNEMIKRALGRKRLDDKKDSLERRYQFYIENVQPSIDYLKLRLGLNKVALIDAHQPVYNDGDIIDIENSIKQVTLNVLNALGLPSYLLNMNS